MYHCEQKEVIERQFINRSRSNKKLLAISGYPGSTEITTLLFENITNKPFNSK